MGKGDFAKDCLKAHNRCRKLHGVPKLKLSSDLSKHAQKWAEHLVEVGSLSHNEALYKGDRLGENVAMKWSSVDQDYKAEEFVQQWYSEVKDYDFSSSTQTLKTGHFSQVVWKSSVELGVGMAKKDGRCIVVANYKPAGNFVGHYKDNVLPALKPADAARAGSSSSSDSDDDRGAKGAKTSRPKDGAGSAGPRPTSGATSVSGRSEKVHTSTTTSTSSTGVVKKTTVVTRTITFPDGTVKTEVEEKTEEIPPGAADVKATQSRLADMKLTTTTRPDSAGKAVATAPHKPETPQQFADSALQAHNVYRKKHGAGPLTLAKDLTEYAQKWADHLAKLGSLQHSDAKLKGESIGENVASKWSSGVADYTGQEVTDQWYSEESKYDYSGKSNAGASGHFTQVVWKGSRELGIGKATNSKGQVFVVANYRPAGNYLGQFKDNVSRN